MNFKEFFLREFRIPGPKIEDSILPKVSTQPRWYVFSDTNKLKIEPNPCFEGTPALGSLSFFETFHRQDNIKIFSAAQLELFTKNPKLKKTILHIARGKEMANISKPFADKFLQEMEDKTVNILSKINPSTIIDVESNAPFNRNVASRYTKSKNVPYTSISKNTFGYLADIYANKGSILHDLMQDTEYKKGEGYKDIAVILSIAYKNFLTDIFNETKINFSPSISKETKLSIDTLAAVLARNYIEQALNQYIISKPRTLEDQKIKWLNILQDPRSIKQYLKPSNFFTFDANFWQLQNNKTIVILDDNINAYKTFTEINQRIKSLAPKAEIIWVVGIRFVGVDVKKTPKCSTK